MKYMVIDLEMCKVPKAMRKTGYHRSQEIIQIGAVLVDEEYEITEKFSTYVCPVYGQIDAKIRKLTGITNEHVKDAPKLNDALCQLEDWLGEREVTAVSWSESDLGQLKNEMETKGLHNDTVESLFEHWMDCQKTFTDIIDRGKAFRLDEALILADIVQEGEAHDGLTDAYNTAKLFIKMETTPEFEFQAIYEAARNEEVEHLQFSIGELLAGAIIH